MLKSNCLALTALLALTAAPILAQEGMPAGLVRSSHVVGMDVRNTANENLGDIEDVVFDSQKGTIAYAVVSFGGFLNMGDKLFAVPWESLKPAPDNKALVLDIPKDRLEKAPGFAKNQWPTMDSQWSNEIRTFYGANKLRTDPAPAPATTRDETGLNEPKRDDRGRYPDPARTDNDGMGVAGDRKYDGVSPDALRDDAAKRDAAAAARRMDDVNRDGMNRDVRRDHQGDGARVNANANRQIVSRSGTIRSFERGNTGHLVLTTNEGSELHADLGSVSVLDQNQLKFDNGSRLTVRGYETMKDGKNLFIVTEVTSNDRTVALHRADATIGTDVSANGKTDYSASKYPIRDLSGTITHIEGGGCEESGYGKQVTIRTADGDRTVALAPGYYLDSQRWVLRPNETVSVKGYDYDRNGGRVFIATELRRGNDTWTFRRPDLTPMWANSSNASNYVR